MKAAVLTKTGKGAEAFEIREVPLPEPGEGEVRIKVAAFGLNYADVMARKGLYQDAPPRPSVIGYDVVGVVDKLGKGCSEALAGKRVIALTRFGGYAEYAIANELVTHEVGDIFDNAAATALATQYSTAYYAAHIATNLTEGDHVLIHAAAGGVGLALIHLARRKNCTLYGTVGSAEKIEYIRSLGVHHPINYRTENFVTAIKTINGGRKLDIVFDSIGGRSVKNGYKLLGAGGRMVCYGGAERSKRSHIFNDLRFALGFGIYSPIQFMMQSRSIIGINMLRIADGRPELIKKSMNEVVNLITAGEIPAPVGRIFNITQLGEAHDFLESRKSIGKIAVAW